MCLHSEQQRRVDFQFAALNKASGHNYRSRVRTWYRIGMWVQVLSDARIFCGIGRISDTSIGIWTTLVIALALSYWSLEVQHGTSWQRTLWGSEKRMVALHKDGVGYKKIAKTLKLSCSIVAKTIQRFNWTGSTQNRSRQGWPKKLSARAPHHIQRLCLVNRRNSAASTAAEVEGVGGQPVSAQTIRCTLHQIGLHAVVPEGSLF